MFNDIWIVSCVILFTAIVVRYCYIEWKSIQHNHREAIEKKRDYEDTSLASIDIRKASFSSTGSDSTESSSRRSRRKIPGLMSPVRVVFYNPTGVDKFESTMSAEQSAAKHNMSFEMTSSFPTSRPRGKVNLDSVEECETEHPRTPLLSPPPPFVNRLARSGPLKLINTHIGIDTSNPPSPEFSPVLASHYAEIENKASPMIGARTVVRESDVNKAAIDRYIEPSSVILAPGSSRLPVADFTINITDIIFSDLIGAGAFGKVYR